MNTRIKELRKSLNLTQKQFGLKIGLKPSSINDIEHGKGKVTERTIISICAKYNVNENWLKTGKGEMFNSNEKNFTEFFEIYKHLSPPLQDFLIQSAKILLDKQKEL